jgi:hemoglobin/transferrin/lactoferrin receptor protein
MPLYAAGFLPLYRYSTFKLRPRPLQIAALCGSLGLALPALAQDAPVADSTLKEVVVSGSRAEQAKDDIPATVEVINAQRLESGQMRDIRDIVRDIPNVSVQRAPARFSLAGAPTGRAGNAGFNIRGLDGNRVLILNDGIRVPRSYAFGSNSFGRDYSDISLLKRVEIIKGPSSALYGSDGLAGLVNFISLQPEDFLSQDKTWGGRAGIAYSGDDKGLGLGTTVAGKAGDSMQWLLSAQLSKAKALENQGSNDAPSIDRTTPNPQKDKGRALLGKVVLQPNAAQKHTLSLDNVDKQSDYQLLSARAQLPLAGTAAQIAAATLSADAFTTQERTRFTWDARYKTDIAIADNVQTVVSLQRAHSQEYVGEDRNTSADRVRDVTYNEKTTQLGLQADKLVRMGTDTAQKITYGIDYVHTKVNNLNTGVTPPFGETFPLKRFPDTTETSTALYVQDEIILGNWTVSPAVRYDRFSIDASQAGFAPPSSTPAASLSGSAASPKLGVLYRATPQWSVFGNYASGFKAPNAGQVNAFFENLTSFYKTIPNPNLKPEKSRNLELGVRGNLDALTLDVSAFTGRFKDLIEDSRQVGGAGVPGNPTIFQSVNIGNVTISGFEVKANVQWGSFAGGKMSSPVAYGQTKGKDNATGKPLNSIDPAKLSTGLAFNTAAWEMRLSVTHYAGKSEGDIDSASIVAPPTAQFTVPSATTLDLSGQWRIRKDLRLNVALNNLTNKKYWQWNNVRGLAGASNVTDAYTQPGRNVALSLVADF